MKNSIIWHLMLCSLTEDETYINLHDVISQKIVFFIATAVRTPDLTCFNKFGFKIIKWTDLFFLICPYFLDNSIISVCQWLCCQDQTTANMLEGLCNGYTAFLYACISSDHLVHAAFSYKHILLAMGFSPKLVSCLV